MAFKMKGSPMQRNYGISPVKSIIGDVVASVGSKLQNIGKAAGDFKAKRKKVVADKAKASPDGLTNFQKRQADRAAQRESGGKSKYQRDVRKGKASRKAKNTKKPNTENTESSLSVKKDGNLNYNASTKNSSITVPKIAEQQVKLKKKVKKKIVAPTTDYNSMSVNDLVTLREGGNKDVQGIINSKLKANPNKWD